MIDYELAINIIDIIQASLLIMMLAVSWYYVGFFFISLKKVKKVPHSDKYTRFVVLIPARNEGKVVGNIIHALKMQTYPKEYFDVYFIVEDENDLTVKLALENGYKYFVRDELTEQRKTKGFALQECIRYFMNNGIHYDAYMIFDADNVMETKFIEKMNDVRQTGVQVGVGYRNFTNASTNWLTVCNATLFTYMNTFTSRGRTELFKKALLSGTGYYIDSEIIDNIGEWIFTGMTEDTELTGYCYYHNVNMRYYPRAVFYDEQSPDLKVNRRQHMRWIWGFFYDKKKVKANAKEMNYHATKESVHRNALFEYTVGIVPFAIFAIVAFLLIIGSFILGIFSIWQDPSFSSTLFFHVLGQTLFMYSFFFFLALITNLHQRKYLKYSASTILWASATYCFYFVELLFAFLDGLFHPKKRKTWSVIKHDGKINNKDANKVIEK